MFPPGGLDHHRPAAAGPGGRAGRVRPLAPVRGAKEVLGQVPGVLPRRGDRDPGEGQIRALITVAGNPVPVHAGRPSLDEVLPKLDAMIAVDLWLNETTRHADVILPGLSPLEQPHRTT